MKLVSRAMIVPTWVLLASLSSSAALAEGGITSADSAEMDLNPLAKVCEQRTLPATGLPSSYASVVGGTRGRYTDIHCYRLEFPIDQISAELMRRVVAYSPYGELKDYRNLTGCYWGTSFVTADQVKKCDEALASEKERLRILEEIPWPSDLYPIRDYFKEEYEFGVWKISSERKFLQVSSAGALQEKHGKLDPATACSSQIAFAVNYAKNPPKTKLPGRPFYLWDQCVDSTFRAQESKYPIESWKRFEKRISVRIQATQFEMVDQIDDDE
jgi:hypothetical protein